MRFFFNRSLSFSGLSVGQEGVKALGGLIVVVFVAAGIAFDAVMVEISRSVAKMNAGVSLNFPMDYLNIYYSYFIKSLSVTINFPYIVGKRVYIGLGNLSDGFRGILALASGGFLYTLLIYTLFLARKILWVILLFTFILVAVSILALVGEWIFA
ncbi:hypothetical protein [Magnetospirillum sp. SS-4]|uniref:hypothetical protein n=1 Tax=Magnetospirillum sp. SS-4 TaxID=2681465 RepID=UPI00137D995F|nr:hypothetical protein [Magnetospirillum sp. SS-4]CAA7618383.1 membrane hypothetical protein [Magnetospirillum sp. SS-4]